MFPVLQRARALGDGIPRVLDSTRFNGIEFYNSIVVVTYTFTLNLRKGGFVRESRKFFTA